jgi:general nucleoside transport system permease protein
MRYRPRRVPRVPASHAHERVSVAGARDARRDLLRATALHAATYLVLAGAAVGALVLLLAATGQDAPLALRALWSGSFGTAYALHSATLVRAVPLVLTGLAVTVAFRAGILNIGAEGQLLAGAAATAAVGVTLAPVLGPLTLPVALLAGAAAGAVWAGIAAVARARFGVLDVISTIMLNFVAGYVVSWLVRGPLQEPTRIYPQTPSLPDVARLPRVMAGSRLHLGIVLALVAAGALWLVLARTAAGFRLRAVGANPDAAASAGLVRAGRVAATAFLASGALAGLAGGVEVTGVTFALYENLSPGYGYTAIAVALLARLSAPGVVAAGILFGALEAGATAMQRDAGVPSVVVSAVEALVILMMVALDRWRVGGAGRRRLTSGGGPRPPSSSAAASEPLPSTPPATGPLGPSTSLLGTIGP